MTRFTRIATFGWLSTAISWLTFGYYPATPGETDRDAKVHLTARSFYLTLQDEQ